MIAAPNPKGLHTIFLNISVPGIFAKVKSHTNSIPPNSLTKKPVNIEANFLFFLNNANIISANNPVVNPTNIFKTKPEGPSNGRGKAKMLKIKVPIVAVPKLPITKQEREIIDPTIIKFMNPDATGIPKIAGRVAPAKDNINLSTPKLPDAINLVVVHFIVWI